MKTRVTKLYLVQILDKDGNELKSEITANKGYIKMAASYMKDQIREEKNNSKKRRNKV